LENTEGAVIMQKIMFGFSAKTAVLWGHALLMTCGVLYSIAWYVNWDQVGYMDSLIPKTIYFFAVLCGIVGGMFMLDGLKALALGLRGWDISLRLITLASLTGFIAIMLTTLYGYDRQFTAELSLVFVWAIIELCTVYVLMRYGWLSRSLMFAIMVVIALGLYLSSMCYNFYYAYKFKYTVMFGMDVPNGLWMGILPYAVLVVVISFVLISVFVSHKLPHQEARSVVTWDPDFVKRGRFAFFFWLLLGLVCLIAGLLFNLTLTYHGDFEFTVGIIGAGLLYFVVYYPPGYHISFADPDLVSVSDKIPVKDRKGADEVIAKFAKKLRAKGYTVVEHRGQKAMFDVEMRSMDVLEIKKPGMLVVFKTTYAWPMPWRAEMQMLWGEVTDANNDLAWEVDEMVAGIGKTRR